jgi:uncharacterized membrane protein
MEFENPRSKLTQIHELMNEESTELLELELTIQRSLAEDNLITQNVNLAFEKQISLGDRLSDKISDFGGSWRFIIIFVAICSGWIAFNVLTKVPSFDPYPFIFLNLLLSCLAALQAPLIMMSQNRQELKDRIRAEHDYKINLQAELEVRQLHMKIDQLLKRQWRRLLEIQKVQTEMLDEVLNIKNQSVKNEDH